MYCVIGIVFVHPKKYLKYSGCGVSAGAHFVVEIKKHVLFVDLWTDETIRCQQINNDFQCRGECVRE